MRVAVRLCVPPDPLPLQLICVHIAHTHTQYKDRLNYTEFNSLLNSM